MYPNLKQPYRLKGLLATLEKRRKLDRANFRKDFSDRSGDTPVSYWSICLLCTQ